ncbi:MAG: porin [Pseudomonadota bacterium]
MRCCVAAVLFMFAAAVQAQTVVYGQLAAAVRSSTHVDPLGASRLELGGTNIGTGMLGLRGTETLGGGLAVRYRLEAGFFTDTGALRHNALFGREASIGIDGPFGRFDAGRLQIIGNASEVLVRADPLRGAGQLETVWPGIWTGARYDNAIRYRTREAPLFASVMYSAGEAGGTAHAGRTVAVNSGYLDSAGMLMASYQVSRDAEAKQSRVFTVGATWVRQPLTWHAAYLKARRDKGFLIGAAPGTALFNTDQGFANIRAPADLDVDFCLLGLSAQLAPRWRLRSALFHSDSARATLFDASHGGAQRSLYAMLSYDFSTRTSLLLETDYNRWSGGWAGFWSASAASQLAYRLDGRDTRRTTSLGLNHIF